MVRRTRAEMEETRATLLVIARKVFSDRGYADTSMDDLTAQANLTRGALYHHFGDKKGLLAAAVEQIDAEMDERLQAISDAADDEPRPEPRDREQHAHQRVDDVLLGVDGVGAARPGRRSAVGDL